MDEYAAFLSPARREVLRTAPESHRWVWRDHDVHVLRAPDAEAPVRRLVADLAG